jgi:branched-chain amino acid transport system substrate-binding protein
LSQSVAAIIQPSPVATAAPVHASRRRRSASTTAPRSTSTFRPDVNDDQWRSDLSVAEYLTFMKRYYPEGNTADVFNVYGYSAAQLLVQVLKQCGDDLTRANVMRQAANLKDVRLPMLLPGILINTSADDYAVLAQSRLARFDGERWVLIESSAEK